MPRRYGMPLPLLLGTVLPQRGGVAAGITYLLDDQFTDTRAAGSVDGTPATPGPGTRAVTDIAGTGVVVTSGEAQLSGNNNWDQTNLSYGAQTRTAGLLMIFSANNVAGTEQWSIGWTDTAGTNPGESGFAFRNDHNLDVIDKGSGVGDYCPLTPTTTYLFALVLRAAGAYYFIKGGAFSNWTFLWAGSTDNTATLYPEIDARYSARLNIQYIRVPNVLYLPPILAYDAFTRANGALGTSETAGPESQAVTARTWNNRVGTTQIASNKASASALAGGLAIATVDTGETDVYLSATLARSGNEVGVVLRYADPDNYIRAIHDGTNCKLIKRVGGAETDVISAAVAIGAGSIVVIGDGTSFSLFLNNAKVGSTSTISDAGLQTGTEQGLFSTNTGNTQDAFVSMARGDGAYSDFNDYLL